MKRFRHQWFYGQPVLPLRHWVESWAFPSAAPVACWLHPTSVFRGIGKYLLLATSPHLATKTARRSPVSRPSPFSKAIGLLKPSPATLNGNRGAILLITTKAAWPRSVVPPPSLNSASSSYPDISPGWRGCSSTSFS